MTNPQTAAMVRSALGCARAATAGYCRKGCAPCAAAAANCIAVRVALANPATMRARQAARIAFDPATIANERAAQAARVARGGYAAPRLVAGE